MTIWAQPGLGNDSYIVPAEETTYGVEATPSTNGADARYMWLDTGGDDTDEQNEIVETKAMGLLGDAAEYSQLGVVNAKGQFTMEVPLQGAEWWLKHGMGKDTLTGSAGIGFTHTFSITNLLAPLIEGGGNSPALTVWLNRGVPVAEGRGLIFKHTGTVINALEFSVSKDQNLKMTVEVMCANVNNTGTYTVPIWPAAGAIGFYSFIQGALTADYGGSNQPIPTEEWSLRIENALDGEHFMTAPGNWVQGGGGTWESGNNSGNPWRTRNKPTRGKKMKVTQTFTSEFDRTDMYNDFRNAVPRSTSMTFISDRFIPGTASVPHQLKFLTGPGQVRITEFKPKIEGEGRIRAKTTIKYYRLWDQSITEMGVQMINAQAKI